MKAKVIKTEHGWHSAFSYDGGKTWDYVPAPGFAFATKAEAQADLDKDLKRCAAIDGASAMYQAQYAAACGYRD